MRIWPCVLMMASLTACSRDVRSCESFPNTYTEIVTPERETFGGWRNAIAKARATVAVCYPLRPIQPESGTISLYRAVKAKDGNVYLEYNIQLWSDVRVAFKISDRGEILGGYLYGTYADT
jgi:hypothetical protein